MRSALVVVVPLLFLARLATAQGTPADGRILAARHLTPTAQVKVFDAAGSVRLVAWDRDSMLVRGRIARGERFFIAGPDSAVKLGMDERPDDRNPRACELLIYLPRRSRVSIKTVTADIDTRDIGGWMYTVSGHVRIAGAASSIDVLSMSGPVDLDVTTPFVRARTGDGQVVLRGAPQDADVSTIGGRLDVATTSVVRGQFSTVTGDIRYGGSPAPGAIFDFSSHGGNVELALSEDASGRFVLSSISGPIDNGFGGVRPAASSPHSLTVTLGSGEARVTVRTFKGAIRLKRL